MKDFEIMISEVYSILNTGGDSCSTLKYDNSKLQIKNNNTLIIMKNRKTFILFSILFLIIMNLYSQEKNNLLKVQGDAMIRTTPEILVVNIPIQTKDSIYQNCTEKLISQYNQLRDSLIKNNIDEKFIKSDRLSVSENYKWKNQRGPDGYVRIPDGYIGRISARVELEYTVDKLNTILKTLMSDAFKFGYNINFKLSEKQKDTQLENAINLAINDANTKAKIIAENLNIKLSKIKEINFGYKPSYDYFLTREKEVYIKGKGDVHDHDDRNIELDLNPQTIQIQKSIAIIWEIEK
ncbi:MAG: SIMPL domain-containing protein [Mangrovibacterium sp.]